MQETTETQVLSFVQEDPLEKEMATHFTILTWNIPWTEDPGGTVHGVTESNTTEHTILGPWHFINTWVFTHS